MKKFNLILIVLTVSMLLLAACSNTDDEKKAGDKGDSTKKTETKYEPEAINPDTDVCEVCAMAIADDQHATQIILKNDRVLKFDDLGCLYGWIEENGEDEIGAKFVRDFKTEDWILIEDATYVFGEEIETPMAYGIISFKERSDAEKYIEENEVGEILAASDLSKHKWEMMNHDHDHGDHDHGNHEHGFHTEGFDLHLSDLTKVKAGEEVNVEVDLTLEEAPLENANVRYEIWKKDDKDNTDWVNATENNPGSYEATYTFEEATTYHVQIHVEDDNDLHEHMEVEVIVGE